MRVFIDGNPVWKVSILGMSLAIRARKSAETGDGLDTPQFTASCLVLFDSGQAVVKPAGLKVLKQVSDVLKDVPDKQIRIEGHTDNVPIGVKLRDKFAPNWELSTTRATSIVQVLNRGGRREPRYDLGGGLCGHEAGGNQRLRRRKSVE